MGLSTMTEASDLPNFQSFLEGLFPGLLDSARTAVIEGENRLAQNSFLWEHTLFVTALTYRLCRLEGKDPRLPLLAALFHDAGKLHARQKEDKGEAEEEVAAERAERVLKEFHLPDREIASVSAAIKALYRSGATPNPAAAVVHDADFLSKSGHLGVASFFIKSALRGRNIRVALLEHVSKELTYAKALVGNMRTPAGRDLAGGKSRVMEEFHRGLLRELEADGIDRFVIEETEFPCPRAPQKKGTVVLVLPAGCPRCAGRPSPSFATREGLKCLKLVTKVECGGCGFSYEMSFCLPEMLCP
jgi:putative nucleotidyltransferase with HDIG domain